MSRYNQLKKNNSILWHIGMQTNKNTVKEKENLVKTK